MPIFEYICDSCGHRTESTTRGDIHHCENCGLTARRRFSFRVASPFREHFNLATGAYVTNRTQFEDRLKMASEEQTLKMGMEVDYQPVDMRDAAACGLTPEDVAEVSETRAKAGVPLGSPA